MEKESDFELDYDEYPGDDIFIDPASGHSGTYLWFEDKMKTAIELL